VEAGKKQNMETKQTTKLRYWIHEASELKMFHVEAVKISSEYARRRLAIDTG
jgi:hypothetical protein